MMTIRSAENKYKVYARIRGNRKCLLAHDANGKTRLLLLMDNPSHVRRATALYLAYRENAAFTDFIESFPYNKGICAVFRHPDTNRMQPLRKILSDASPELRAAALRSLFAKLLAQEPPLFMLCDLLYHRNLLCSTSGEISFIYDLRPLPADLRHAGIRGKICLGETVREICGEMSVPSLALLYEALSAPGPPGWDGLFAAASAAAGELALCRPEPETEKPGLRERVSRTRDKLLERAAVWAALILLAAGYILLGVLFYHTVIAPYPVDNGLKIIGTVILEDEDFNETAESK